MDPLEKIEQIESERREAAARVLRDEEERQARILQEEQERQREATEQRRQKEELDKIRSWRLNDVIKLTNIHGILRRIADGKLGHTPHAIVQHLKKDGSSGDVKLIWGKFKLADNNVNNVVDKKTNNYSDITVLFNIYDDLKPDKSEQTRDFATVKGSEIVRQDIALFPEGGWDNHDESSRRLSGEPDELLTEAIAQAFLSPHHNEWRPPSSYSSSSYTSTQTECSCH